MMVGGGEGCSMMLGGGGCSMMLGGGRGAALWLV